MQRLVGRGESIGDGALGDRPERINVRRFGRHDQLADSMMLDAVRAAVVVQHAPARDAAACLECARRVVHAGMDHLAVARRRAGADGIGALQDQQLAGLRREPARNREADDAGADDDGVDALGHGLLRYGEAFFAIDIGSEGMRRLCIRARA
nr:hypothetical protein [uncultured bacterium]